MIINIHEENYMNFIKSKGHIYLDVKVVYTGSDDDSRINFILDTGAYITVISRQTAIFNGYNTVLKKNVPLTGFIKGNEFADLIEIPGLIIGNKLITKVRVLVPHNEEIVQEVLGQNVLEYFNYFMDTKNSRLYFGLNDNPQLHSKELWCGEIFTIDKTD